MLGFSSQDSIPEQGKIAHCSIDIINIKTKVTIKKLRFTFIQFINNCGNEIYKNI